MNPGKKYQDAYTLTKLGGNEVLVIRSDDEYTKATMIALEKKMREGSPQWTGPMLVLRTDQAIEKMSEQTAYALFLALKQCFDPVVASAAMAVSSVETIQGDA